MSAIYITNAKIILLDTIISRGTVVVKGKKIAAVLKRKQIPPGAVRIDAQGQFAAPGFIDLHIHGDVERVSSQQARGGTTGFLATLHPQRPQALLEDIARVLSRRAKVTGAKVLGLRLEGPFLNRSFCGALSPGLLRQPSLQETKTIIKQAGNALRMMIIAPELKQALGVIRFLNQHRVVASLGHSGASYAQARKGIAAGITHATHTFNRMAGFNHRSPGALGAVLTDNRVQCEIIPDGVHTHPAALKLLLACKGLDKMMLVTDSTAAQIYPAKKRTGLVFRLKNGTLYGTALTLNKALKNASRFLDLTLPRAIRLVTLNPARVLKIDRNKGTLAVGKDADIVVFDRDFKVKMTMVEGKIVYHNL